MKSRVSIATAVLAMTLPPTPTFADGGLSAAGSKEWA